MKRLLLALVLVPGIAFADDKPADPPPAPPPAPKVLETPKKARSVTIVDGTKDSAAGDRQCEPNDVGQIECKG